MGDAVTFRPNTGVNPTFEGRGSKIERPDVLPIFLGSGWSGAGGVTAGKLMTALNSMAIGPYFDGLKQYGYVGPVQIRAAQMDTQPYTVVLPALTPGMDQANNVGSAVLGYIANLLDNDGIADVDDNHDLIVVVFLDSSNPLPSKMNAAGVVSTSAGGANAPYFGDYEFLDDSTRFQFAWINTASGSIDTITRAVSHELVESISDPFNSGWHQTQPVPARNLGQLSDVCDQPAIVDGVAVTAYWSNADGACVVPTRGTRRVTLSHAITKHEQHDGPPKQGYVSMGPLCASGYFDYFERTWLTDVTINATLQGYEDANVVWKINGTVVPLGTGTVDVAVEWDPEPRPMRLGARHPKPAVAHLQTWVPSKSATEIRFSIGPGDGNCYLTIEADARESFDDSSAGGDGRTQHHAMLELDLQNQMIVWDEAYGNAKKQCDRMRHLADGPGVVLGPPRPGDPPDLAHIINQAIRDTSSQRDELLQKAAEMVRATRPELAHDLLSLVQRTHAARGSGEAA